MSDFERMLKNIGNRYDMILVASERMREIQRERKLQEELMRLDSNRDVQAHLSSRKRQTVPAHQAFDDIEQGRVGTEYLDRIRERYERSNSRKK